MGLISLWYLSASEYSSEMFMVIEGGKWNMVNMVCS